MKHDSEYIIYDAYHGKGDRIIIPFSGTIVHHDRKNQDHGGDDKTKRFHHKAVGNKEEAIENGAQFLLKWTRGRIAVRARPRAIHALLSPLSPLLPTKLSETR